jgi:hypothetical protein
MFCGTSPSWGYAQNWGYRPMGGVGLILIILVVLLLLGKL